MSSSSATWPLGETLNIAQRKALVYLRDNKAPTMTVENYLSVLRRNRWVRSNWRPIERKLSADIWDESVEKDIKDLMALAYRQYPRFEILVEARRKRKEQARI